MGRQKKISAVDRKSMLLNHENFWANIVMFNGTFLVVLKPEPELDSFDASS